MCRLTCLFFSLGVLLFSFHLYGQTGPETYASVCKDGKDNDGDGKTDCNDPDCSAMVFCGSAGEGAAEHKDPENTEEACKDELDNDHDGKVDCADLDCYMMEFCQPAAEAKPAPEENTAKACQDKMDNDGDGKADCNDPDCEVFTFCVPLAASGIQGSVNQCKADTDCNSGLVCIRGECMSTYSGSAAPRISSGKGFFITGLVLSLVGIGLMASAIGVGHESSDKSEDEVLPVCLPIGLTGALMTMVGNGLIQGANIRVIRSSGAIGVRKPLAPFIAGWVLFGLFLPTLIALGVAEIDHNLIFGPEFIAPLALEAATLIVVAAGWGYGWSRVKEAQSWKKASAASLSPFVAPVRGGGMAGLSLVY